MSTQPATANNTKRTGDYPGKQQTEAKTTDTGAATGSGEAEHG